MKQFFIELFDFNHNCNQNLAAHFNQHPQQISEKSLQLYSHILNAHQIWNNRIEPHQNPFSVWEMHLIQDFKNIDIWNYEYSQLILNRLDLNQFISYTNTRGDTFNNSIRDILFHIINHSTYHRGQIATEFKLNGIIPLVTDYVIYKR